MEGPVAREPGMGAAALSSEKRCIWPLLSKTPEAWPSLKVVSMPCAHEKELLTTLFGLQHACIMPCDMKMRNSSAAASCMYA